MTELNIAPFIEAESDRIVGDDLIAGPRTFTVSKVSGVIDEKKKKRLVLQLDGANKPFIPCKGMARLLGHFWGADAAKWVGRVLTLYRDPDVRFGADTTGGVRVCAVSDIDRTEKVPIRTSQKSVKTYEVKPVEAPKPQPGKQTAEQWASEHIAAVQNAPDTDALGQLITKGGKAMGKLKADKPELWAEVNTAYTARAGQLEQEGKPDADMGEGFTDDDLDFA